MKFFLVFILVCSVSMQSTFSQVRFDSYFSPKTMRLDYYHSGSALSGSISFVKLKEEPYWAGSHTQLIDTFQYGNYMLSIFDKLTNKLIYSRGYSTLFPEWQKTKLAKTEQRTFYETVVFPYPLRSVRLVIGERNWDNEFNKVFELDIDPKNIYIEKGLKYDLPIIQPYYSGDPSKKIDIVILPEGYTASELDKFELDAKRFIGLFFRVPPFSEHKDKVNFSLVMAPSAESGTDIPGDKIWKNTVLDSHFYTFNSRRYLTTQNINTVRNLAALVPYDQIYILVNSSIYGGSGIYNYYNLCVSDHPLSSEVFTHEFGHAFAALSDEYAYQDSSEVQRFNYDVEPWQPNITTLVNFSSKWKDMLSDSIPIPTPSGYSTPVGVFEGAGNIKHKLFRPAVSCKMRTTDVNYFCPVCYSTVLAMLKFYSD